MIDKEPALTPEFQRTITSSDLKSELVPEFTEINEAVGEMVAPLALTADEERAREERLAGVKKIDAALRDMLLEENLDAKADIELYLEKTMHVDRRITSLVDSLPAAGKYGQVADIVAVSADNNFGRASAYFKQPTVEQAAAEPISQALTMQRAVAHLLKDEIAPDIERVSTHQDDASSAIRRLIGRVDGLEAYNFQEVAAFRRHVQDLLVMCEDSDKSRHGLSGAAEEVRRFLDTIAADISEIETKL